VILLQEVNPLPEIAAAYVAALKGFGLHYAGVHQVDSCGIRLAPGLAVVPGLNNGLVILAKSPLKIRKVKGLKLSGGPGGCWDFMGLQFGELRYALIAAVENPNTGREFLVANTHLHSGLERDAFFLQRIAEAQQRGTLPSEEAKKLVAAFEQGQRRRLDEVRTLIGEVLRLKAERMSLGVVVGGDMNFEPDAPEYQELEKVGLRDTYAIATSSGEVHSLDPQQNAIARHAAFDVPSPLRRTVAHLSENDQEKILDAYRKGVSQPRRIDFLFLLNSLDDSRACLRQELFGESVAVTVDPASDHYGVLVTYLADSPTC
jgi:endonuclease/exonuclease/phosphatase family metal-dependent hydrolase